MAEYTLAEMLEWKYGAVANTKQDPTDIPQGAKDNVQTAENALLEARGSEDEASIKGAEDQLKAAENLARIARERVPNPKMVITKWSHPTISEPDDAQIKQDMAEYTAWRNAQPEEKSASERLSELETRVSALEEI